MTDAPTGNTMIPSHPGIVATQISEGAAAVAPQSAGAPPTVGVQPAPELDAGDFWSGIEQRVAPTAVEPAPIPLAPVAPQAAPQVPPPAAVVPPAIPVPSPGQAQVPAPVAAPQVPAPDQPTVLTPEQQAVLTEAAGQQAVPAIPAAAPVAAPTDLAALEQRTIDHLARTEYAIPEDVATQLVSEPEKVYPVLAARLHVRLATQLGQAVQQMLPTVIDQMVGQKLASYRLETEFFQKYPQLNDPRFRPVVLQSLTMARHANPQAGADQVMNDGATLAAMKLRLGLPGQAAVVPQVPAPQISGQTGQQIPAQIPGQPYVAPVAPVAPVPFQPALGGGGHLPTQPQGDVNEFELLALDQNW